MKSALSPEMTSHLIDGYQIDVLFSENDIKQRIGSLAFEVANLKPHRLLVVPVLKGSFIFAADLIRAMHHAGLSPEVDFMILASYRKALKSSGNVEVLRDIETDVSGRDVLLVDDILESGRTLAFAKDLLMARGAKSVRSAVLLHKPGHLAANIASDLIGFECPDKFVVGFGMDMAHQFRELPFVGHVVRGPTS
jgi:hypoxanthine phosphoribosyltransferase